MFTISSMKTFVTTIVADVSCGVVGVSFESLIATLAKHKIFARFLGFLLVFLQIIEIAFSAAKNIFSLLGFGWLTLFGLLAVGA